MRSGSSVLDPAPPRTGGGEGGGWAWLVTARGIVEAELIRGLLESHGVLPVWLDASDPSPGSWMFMSGNVNALVRVYVPRSMLDDAKLVLLETGLELESPPPQDPAAGRSWRWWTWLVLAVVLVSILLLATWRASVT